MTSSMPVPESPEAAGPEAPTAPRPAKRRWWRSALQVGVIAIVAGAIAWGLSQYLDPPPRYALDQEASAALLGATPEEQRRVGRYGHQAAVTMATLTPEVMAVLEPLTASLAELAADMEATEDRLRQADPHLDRALDDPVEVPFRSENPVLSRDVLKGFLSTLEVMLNDYASRASAAERKLIEPLRRCMTATLLKQSVPADDLAQLEAAWQAGSDAPLLLLCLHRCYPRDQRQGEWMWQALAAQQKRPVCVETAAFISSNVLDHRSQLSSPQLLATLLMDVEIRAGNTPRSADEWFRHALAARFGAGYHNDIYEIQAEIRWGGSPEKQIWLAQKYVETGDLDSQVPARISAPLWDLCQDQGRSYALGSDPEILKIATDFVQLLRSHSQDKPHASVTAPLATIVAMTLWDGGAYEDLDWFFNVYGGTVHCHQFHESRLHSTQMAQIVKRILDDPSTRWETIRRALFSDSRQVTLADLDRTDMAIRQLRQQDDRSDDEHTKLLETCQRSASQLRRLLSHQEVVMSDKDLQSWLVVDNSITATFPRLPGEGNAEAAEDNSEPAPPIVDIDDAAGVVDLRVWVAGQKGLLMCPFQIDPPLSFSMDVQELVRSDDPFGISLLVGPALDVAELTGYVGPMLTLNSSHNQVIRGHLPRVEWNQNVSSLDYKRQMPKYTLKIEAYPDGYRTYFGDQQLETVRTPLHTGGLLQLGRYISLYYNDMPQEYVKYRVSNVRLQKLKQHSVDAAEGELDRSTI